MAEKIDRWILDKIVQHGRNGNKDAAKDLFRVLILIHKEDSAVALGKKSSTTLKHTFIRRKTSQTLKKYLDELLSLTKEPGNNSFYANIMRDFYLDHCNRRPLDELALREFKPDDVYHQTYDRIKASVYNELHSEDLSTLVKALGSGKKSWLTGSLSESGKLVVSRAGGSVVTVGLVVAQVGYEMFKNIHLWWTKKITGKQCAKNILDSLASIAGATGGEVVGAVIGAEVGGMLGIGSLCCGLLGGAVTKSLMEEVTWSIFDTTQTDAKVNAYDYMGVNKNASDEEINRAYHKKLRQCHPDKGGSEEQFLQLQMHLQVIRMARGHDL